MSNLVGKVYELEGFTWKVSKQMADESVRSVKQVDGKGCKGKPRKHTKEQLELAQWHNDVVTETVETQPEA